MGWPPSYGTATVKRAYGDWITPLGQVGTWLLKHDPSFDPSHFGFKKLSDLVRAQASLYVRVRVREG